MLMVMMILLLPMILDHLCCYELLDDLLGNNMMMMLLQICKDNDVWVVGSICYIWLSEGVDGGEQLHYIGVPGCVVVLELFCLVHSTDLCLLPIIVTISSVLYLLCPLHYDQSFTVLYMLGLFIVLYMLGLFILYVLAQMINFWQQIILSRCV